MGIPAHFPEPDSAPPLATRADVVYLRDRTLRLALEMLAARERRRHPGRLVTVPNMARELLWQAIRDPATDAPLDVQALLAKEDV